MGSGQVRCSKHKGGATMRVCGLLGGSGAAPSKPITNAAASTWPQCARQLLNLRVRLRTQQSATLGLKSGHLVAALASPVCRGVAAAVNHAKSSWKGTRKQASTSPAPLLGRQVERMLANLVLQRDRPVTAHLQQERENDRVPKSGCKVHGCVALSILSSAETVV